MFLFMYLLSCRPDQESEIKKARENLFQDPSLSLKRLLSSSKSEIAKIEEAFLDKSKSEIVKELLMQIDEDQRASSLSVAFKMIEDISTIIEDDKIAGLSIDQILKQLKHSYENSIPLFSAISELEAKGDINFNGNNYRKLFLEIIFDRLKNSSIDKRIELAKEAANILSVVNIEDLSKIKIDSKLPLGFSYPILREAKDSRALKSALLITSFSESDIDKIKNILPKELQDELQKVFSDILRERLSEDIELPIKEIEAEKVKAELAFESNDIDSYNESLKKIYDSKENLLYSLSNESNQLSEEELKEKIDIYFSNHGEDQGLLLIDKIKNAMTFIFDEEIIQDRLLREGISSQIMNNLELYLKEAFTKANIPKDFFNQFLTNISTIYSNLRSEEREIIHKVSIELYEQYIRGDLDSLILMLNNFMSLDLDSPIISNLLSEISQIIEDKSIPDKKIAEAIAGVKKEAINIKLMNEYISSGRDSLNLKNTSFDFNGYIDNREVIDHYLSQNYKYFSLEIPQNERVAFLRSLFSIKEVSNPYRTIKDRISGGFDSFKEIDISYEEDRDLYLQIAQRVAPNNELFELIERDLLKIKAEDRESLIRIFKNIDVEKLKAIVSKSVKENEDLTAYKRDLEEKREFFVSLLSGSKKESIESYFKGLLSSLNQKNTVHKIISQKQEIERLIESNSSYNEEGESIFDLKKALLIDALNHSNILGREEILRYIELYFNIDEREDYELLLIDKIVEAIKIASSFTEYEAEIRERVKKEISTNLVPYLKKSFEKADISKDYFKQFIKKIIFLKEYLSDSEIEAIAPLYQELYMKDIIDIETLEFILTNEIFYKFSPEVTNLAIEHILTIIKEDKSVSDQKIVEIISNVMPKSSRFKLTNEYISSGRDSSQLELKPFEFNNYLDNKAVIDYYLSKGYKKFKVKVRTNEKYEFIRTLFSIEEVKDVYKIVSENVEGGFKKYFSKLQLSYTDEKELYELAVDNISDNQKLIEAIKRDFGEINDASLIAKIVNSTDLEGIEKLLKHTMGLKKNMSKEDLAKANERLATFNLFLDYHSVDQDKKEEILKSIVSPIKKKLKKLVSKIDINRDN